MRFVSLDDLAKMFLMFSKESSELITSAIFFNDYCIFIVFGTILYIHLENNVCSSSLNIISS